MLRPGLKEGRRKTHIKLNIWSAVTGEHLIWSLNARKPVMIEDYLDTGFLQPP